MEKLCITVSPFNPQSSGPLIPQDFLPGQDFVDFFLQPLNFLCLLMETIKGFELLEFALLLFQVPVYIPKHPPVPPLEIHLTVLQPICDFILKVTSKWILHRFQLFPTPLLSCPHGLEEEAFLCRLFRLAILQE